MFAAVFFAADFAVRTAFEAVSVIFLPAEAALRVADFAADLAGAAFLADFRAGAGLALFRVGAGAAAAPLFRAGAAVAALAGFRAAAALAGLVVLRAFAVAGVFFAAAFLAGPFAPAVFRVVAGFRVAAAFFPAAAVLRFAGVGFFFAAVPFFAAVAFFALAALREGAVFLAGAFPFAVAARCFLAGAALFFRAGDAFDDFPAALVPFAGEVAFFAPALDFELVPDFFAPPARAELEREVADVLEDAPVFFFLAAAIRGGLRLFRKWSYQKGWRTIAVPGPLFQ